VLSIETDAELVRAHELLSKTQRASRTYETSLDFLRDFGPGEPGQRPRSVYRESNHAMGVFLISDRDAFHCSMAGTAILRQMPEPILLWEAILLQRRGTKSLNLVNPIIRRLPSQKSVGGIAVPVPRIDADALANSN